MSSIVLYFKPKARYYNDIFSIKLRCGHFKAARIFENERSIKILKIYLGIGSTLGLTR